MPGTTKPKVKITRSIHPTRGFFGTSITIVLRVILVFAAVTAGLVLFGVAYMFVVRRRFDALAIPAWFLSLSIEQWIDIAGGLVVAVMIVTVPCSHITARSGSDGGLLVVPRRIVRNLTVGLVLFLYAVGVFTAYHVSLALHHSRDWAIIHSLYSWVYVGFSFSRWVVDHWAQPFGKTLHQFRTMMKM